MINNNQPAHIMTDSPNTPGKSDASEQQSPPQYP